MGIVACEERKLGGEREEYGAADGMDGGAMTSFDRAELLVATIVLALGRCVFCRARVEGEDLVLRPIAMGRLRAARVPAMTASEAAVRDYRRSRWARPLRGEAAGRGERGGAA